MIFNQPSAHGCQNFSYSCWRSLGLIQSVGFTPFGLIWVSFFPATTRWFLPRLTSPSSCWSVTETWGVSLSRFPDLCLCEDDRRHRVSRPCPDSRTLSRRRWDPGLGSSSWAEFVPDSHLTTKVPSLWNSAISFFGFGTIFLPVGESTRYDRFLQQNLKRSCSENWKHWKLAFI